MDVHENGAALELGNPHEIMKAAMAGNGDGPFVPSADGKKFLINLTGGDTTVQPLRLVTNWTADLKK